VIPYFPQPSWSVGPFTIHAFGAAAAVALVFSYWLTLRRAPAFGIKSTEAGTVFVAATVMGLAAAWIVARGAGMSGSGLAIGAAAAVGIAAWRRRSWELLDLFGFVFPFLLVIVRTGCFFAHDHVGRRTDNWLGVQFPGGTRFDLGLQYALSAAGVGVVVLIARGRAVPGVLFGIAMALLAITRLVIVRLGSSISVMDEVVAGIAFLVGCQIVLGRILSTRPRSHAA